jgi:hypothetical protein
LFSTKEPFMTRSSLRSFRHGCSALGVCLALASGCAADRSVTTFVGPTSDPAIFVAVSTDDTKVVAYVCDGDTRAGAPDAVPGVSVWLASTPAERDTIDLAADGFAVHATLGARATGTAMLASGATLTFDLSSSDASADTGLFFADQLVDGTHTLGGWIVLSDGQQRGAVKVEGGGGVGHSVIGPVLLPQTRTIFVTGVGMLHVAPFDPKGFEGGGGVGRTL